MASDWIGAFKGPDVCTQRFSRIRLTLVRERGTSAFQDGDLWGQPGKLASPRLALTVHLQETGGHRRAIL